MRTLFLSSSGLNESTTKLFWECIGKEPQNTKVIFVPSAAIENDAAREGIVICLERLMSMGIPISNIFLYDLALLLSDGYKRTYSSYVDDIPTQIRLMNVEELSQYDTNCFAVAMPQLLLNESKQNRVFKTFKTGNREWVGISGD